MSSALRGIAGNNKSADALETLVVSHAAPEEVRRPMARVYARDSLWRRTLALTDVLALCAAYALTWLFTSHDQPLVAKLALAAALPFWVLLNKLLGLYDRDANVIKRSTLEELPRILQSVVLGSALVYLAGPVFPGLEPHRLQAVVFIATASVLAPAARIAVRRVLARVCAPERCLIVGSGEVATDLARTLVEDTGGEVELIGFIDDRRLDDEDSVVPDSLGDVADFERVCLDLEVERVVIAFSTLLDKSLLGVLRASKHLGIKVSIVPRLFEGIGPGVEVDKVQGITLLGLRGLGRTRSSLALKRAIDIVGAAAGLVLVSPLLLAITITVKLDSRGPVFYSQSRIGRGTRPFRMYKFRTMREGAHELRSTLLHLNEAAGPLFKISNDPRLTRVGRFLRRYSLDELPQLWNVLRGDMSLVGPRPLVPEEDSQIMGLHRARLDLTPGLTGPWQVLSRRHELPFERMIELDFLYVADWSLWNDLKLLLRTTPVVLNGRGH